MLCAALKPSDKAAEFQTHVGSPGSGGISGATSAEATPGQLQQIADYLVDGFWWDQGEWSRSFDVQAGGTLTYDVTGLGAKERFLAVNALQAWSDVSGLKFKAISNPDHKDQLEGADARGGTTTQDNVALNQHFIGEIANGGDVDAIRVNLTAGVDYLVTLESLTGGDSRLDGVIRILDAFGNEVTSLDYERFKPELLPLTVDTTGTYYIVVEGFQGSRGEYDLSFKKAGDIVFTNSYDGAYSYSALDGGNIQTSIVNVAQEWDVDPKSLNSYWFQTYLHEIGHALGLGHAGDYNGDARFGPDHEFRMDSWQATVMSYFAQTDNPNTDASVAFISTLMPADILAIQSLYGDNVTTRAGDTVYGVNSNVGGYLGRMFGIYFDGDKATEAYSLGYDFTFTVFDTGGNDTLSLGKGRTRIDLNDGASSDTGGLRGNVLIAVGTMIENAIGGGRDDSILGNEVANTLTGKGGNDKLLGALGADTLNGGQGADRLDGGRGLDTVLYLGSSDVRINLSKTLQKTGQGEDRLLKIENVVSGSGDDTLTGNDVANILGAGGGDDQLIGGNGNDQLIGGTGDDQLIGGNGDDRLSGGRGNDILRGQAGNDELNGGWGSDTFVYLAGDDTITDFADNVDTIQISRSALSDPAIAVLDFLELAVVVGSDLVFNLSAGNRITIAGLTDANVLADDLILV
jgi:serralysin